MNNETEQIFLLNAAPSQPSAPAQRLGALAPPPSSQVNLENVEDFSHVCRTCATITEFVMPVFAGEGLQNNLADKIKKHLPIQVCEGDELPLVVCYQCASTLLAWHELVKCCMQADAALRAKLSSTKRKTNSTSITITSNSSVEQEAQSKYLPAYPKPLRVCVYCSSSHPDDSYKEHLVTAHSDLLFHCEECDTFVDRKDFILHMSFHAVQYTTQDFERKKNKEKKEENISQNPSPAPTAPALAPIPDNKQIIKTEDKKPPMVVKTKSIVQENEFSDHSDTDGFEPLPESVFEAIEDSQDSQHLEDNTSHTLKNEQISEDSNKSSQPEINSLTDPALTLANNFNNCTVVIEPMNIDECTEMNITIKNNNVNILNNNPSLPTKKSAPKDKKNQRKPRKCPFCGKEYEASSSYFYHLKYSHRGSKEHECEVCGNKFGTRAGLAQHMTTHSAQYDYQCKHCEKRFKSKASLYIHEQTHTGTKAWSCSQCQRAFRWQTHLRRHEARHAAARPHACTQPACGRAFSVRADLLRHARTHHAGAFSCDTCGQKFAQLRYLKVHSAKQHSNMMEASTLSSSQCASADDR